MLRTNYYEKAKTTYNFANAAPLSTTTSGGRGSQAVTFVDVLILPDPYDASDNSPVKLANSLYDKKHELKEIYPIYDETYGITTLEVLGQDPAFLITPSVSSVVN